MRRLFSTKGIFTQRWLDAKLVRPVEVLKGADLTVDCRELQLVSILKKKKFPFTTRQMSVGDIEIFSEDSGRIIIERKSVDDLYSSIKTGRLMDQLSRIFEHERRDTKSMVVLVLEGQLLAGTTPPAIYHTVLATYTSLLLRDRLSVLRTDSVDETARLVVSLAGGDRLRSLFRPASDFSNLVTHRPAGRKLSGAHLPYLKLLMAIRGVSGNRAEAIAKKFPTLESLMIEIRSNGPLRLSQLVASSNARSTGSPIGPATALHIVEALLGPSDPLVAEFKLVKHILAATSVASAVANGWAKQYGSIANLRRAFLTDPNSVPDILQPSLAALVDDPETLSSGLRGVKGVSFTTADALTSHFNNVAQLEKILRPMTHQETMTYIRMLGPGRMIARPAVENVIIWLASEGYVSSAPSSPSIIPIMNSGPICVPL